MNYDTTTLPETYDTARALSETRVEFWMDVVARCVDATRLSVVVDLGCGTGRFSGGLARRFSAQVIGVDPSRKMLERAESKPITGVTYLRGAAEALPLEGQSVDLVFASMVYHHFDDPGRALSECYRVLRVGGVCFFRNCTSELAGACPYAPHFPGVSHLLRTRLPARKDIRATAERAGFRIAVCTVTTQTTADTYAEYADKLAAGGDSVLATLPRRDFDAGIQALRVHARIVDPCPVQESIDVFVLSK